MGNSCSLSRPPTCGLPFCGRRVRRQPRVEPRSLDWSSADEGKWDFPEITYNGRYVYSTEPQFEEVQGLIDDGLETLKAEPEKYDGIMYQTNMVGFPEDQQTYKLIQRTGSGFDVRPEDGGSFTFVQCRYLKLDADVDLEPDDYTDTVLATYGRQRLGTPVHPGRGEGCADVPSLTIMSDVDPSDVSQGGVGDCWLLSAISSLAEFDGAIAKLFRNTNWWYMPKSGPNYYTITLYDLPSWSEVNIDIDERLCTKPGGKDLLGAQPSVDGELWVCYLEKAIAAHSGGWDKIDGGTTPQAWRMLTGCRDVYTIKSDGHGFSCFGAKNTNTGEWEELENSPHDGFQGLWPMDWPEVGGGGSHDEAVSADELFDRMCQWDEHNFIMAAGTKSGSDTQSTDGVVDGHAYAILTVLSGVAGTDFDLIKMRNPWGKGEFQKGKWIDGGPGWDENPEVFDEIQPVDADDGIFWMDKDEFFTYFHRVYLCAMDMSSFIG